MPIRQHSCLSLALRDLAVVPPCLWSLHAESQIDARRGSETKRASHGRQIQLVHVEDISQGMTSVGKQIGPVCVPRCTIEVIVLLDQPLQLRLHVRQLFHRKLVLIQCNFRRFQISQKPSLLRSKEEQSTACALISSSCAANLFREKG